ncbi:flagellar biosynthesis protein [Roseovarius sp. 2305UL8-3]|uniref:flagellar biosynthesis protein n=1 Tax=Roseovarius conchicola TaxID=3121636 RepID=UPI003528BD35
MSISHLLEDFGAYARGKPVSLTDVSLEEQRLEAFEKGYQAGWDDSSKASEDDTRRVSVDLAQNLQDLSITYQEAHSAVLASLRPLLEQITQTVLPALMLQTLGAQLVDQVHGMARELGPQPIELVTAPSNAATLEALLGDDPAMPVTVIEELSLGEGQVFVRFGNHEREIDLSGVLATIEQMMTGFFDENQKETA